MKALSLTQPWATAIALGIKRYETRSWSTGLRGDICIHAAKGFPAYAQQFFEDQQQEGLLLPDSDLPRGAIIAVCSLTACLHTEDVWPTIEPIERMYGNYEPGRYAFRLANVRVLPTPVFCKGALSFWPVPPEIEAQILGQLEAARSASQGEKK